MILRRAMSRHHHLFISVREQRLFLFKNGICETEACISTAKNGVGELFGSECTPRGWHIIEEVIGLGMPIHTVFKARQPTGQIYNSKLNQEFPCQDWILSRIFRLKGQEIGFNLNGRVDSYQRYIYIHGCADEASLGRPASHGCIRMSNQAIIKIADLVAVGDQVFIG